MDSDRQLRQAGWNGHALLAVSDRRKLVPVDKRKRSDSDRIRRRMALAAMGIGAGPIRKFAEQMHKQQRLQWMMEPLRLLALTSARLTLNEFFEATAVPIATDVADRLSTRGLFRATALSPERRSSPD